LSTVYHLFFNNLTTSERQLGFKKGVSCAHALRILRTTCNHFNLKGNTVCLGLVDIRKAFDKANFWGILRLFQKRAINPEIINILEFWFSISSARVFWNGHPSVTVFPTAGVRQGGILSPLFFAAYIDVLLSTLEKCKIGCFINGKCYNSLLYADDLLLLSISVCDLSKLINICKTVLDDLDLQVNFEKTCCLRVGSRAGVACAPIVINSHPIQWVSSAKYLGITLLAKSKFCCDWHPTKRKFFTALNSILHALGSNPSPQVVLSLFRSVCLPILSFGLFSMPLSRADINSFSFTYNNIFNKLFKVNSISNIELCQYYSNFWPFHI